jgi:PadR family transcriptional regulator PadR
MPRYRRGWAISQQASEQELLSPLMGSLIEPALLILLKKKPQHGYNLIDNLGTLGLGTPHPSVVYRILRDMEILQWIHSQWDAEETQGPPRRIYTLTPQGEDALQSWLTEMQKAGELIKILSLKTDEGKEL